MSVNRKKVLELYDFGDGLGIRQLSEALGNFRNTIRKVIRRAEEVELTKELLATMSNGEIDALLKSTVDETGLSMPDFVYISKELEASSDVNLKLLWNEYYADCLKVDSTPYQYSRFCELYAQWEKKANVTRRIIHKPGYACQVDWVGSWKSSR